MSTEANIWVKAHEAERNANYIEAVNILFALYNNISPLRYFVIQEIFRIIRLVKNKSSHQNFLLVKNSVDGFFEKKLSQIALNYISIQKKPFDISDINTAIEKIKKSEFFVRDWYLEKYRDIIPSDAQPEEHYLLFSKDLELNPGPEFNSIFYLNTHRGAWQRDSSPLVNNPLIRYISKKNKMTPTPSRVLYSADLVFKSGDREKGIFLANSYLPEDLKYTINILEANKAIEDACEQDWLYYFNLYLEKFKATHIDLENNGGDVFSRIKAVEPLKEVTGELVSVIMPAWNAEKTIKKSIDSILNQSWKNIELIVIDDCSKDGTWQILQNIAKYDHRIKLIKNKVNVGPYVSKNIGLRIAKGKWITGQDADDWSFPERIANHIAEMKKHDLVASLNYMVRITPNGKFDQLGEVGGFSIDGVARKASISCMFDRKELTEKLGYWDSVRFGADSELISRAEKVFGQKFRVLSQLSMICLNLESGLTNNPVTGVRVAGGLSPVRKSYRDAWSSWQAETPVENLRISFPLERRVFWADDSMVVSSRDSYENLYIH